MSQASNITLLANRVGAECKTLHEKIGVLGNLSTTEKTSLVLAINELNTALGKIDVSSVIDDTQVLADKTYSSSKIASEITAAAQQVKNDLLNGAGEAYDTLKELADLIQTNASAIEALEALAAGHVRYDEPQTITDEQKTQARGNIGAASAADLSALDARVGTAEGKLTAVEEKAAANETAITGLTTRVGANEAAIQGNTSSIQTLSDNVGDTNTDFVATFEAALAGTGA